MDQEQLVQQADMEPAANEQNRLMMVSCAYIWLHLTMLAD